MTRIIAGRAGSLSLEVPGAGTRPTSDRVRESLFGALESADAIRGASVLDLYAGSGALALEAVSRGAAAADLVEMSARAATVAQRNATRVARAVGPDAVIRVHRAAADAFLTGPGGAPLWDLAFIDPPYDLDDVQLALTLGRLSPRVSDAGTVVIERASRSPEPSLPAGLRITRSKKYGDTTLWWAARA